MNTRDAHMDSAPGSERVLAVVIGRAGSKGLPRKNALPVAGIPMIARTVRFARASGRIDRTIVSTDGAEIAAIARDEGVDVFLRPDEVSHDTATVEQHLACLTLQLKSMDVGTGAHFASLEIHLELMHRRVRHHELG